MPRLPLGKDVLALEIRFRWLDITIICHFHYLVTSGYHVYYVAISVPLDITRGAIHRYDSICQYVRYYITVNLRGRLQ